MNEQVALRDTLAAGGGLCPHKKKNTKNLRKLGNFKKIPETSRIVNECPAGQLTGTFYQLR